MVCAVFDSQDTEKHENLKMSCFHVGECPVDTETSWQYHETRPKVKKVEKLENLLMRWEARPRETERKRRMR